MAIQSTPGISGQPEPLPERRWTAPERQKLRDDVPRLGFKALIRNQYILAYNPSGPMDGSYRRLKVDVKGVRGASVRHRSGYYATAPKTEHLPAK